MRTPTSSAADWRGWEPEVKARLRDRLRFGRPWWCELADCDGEPHSAMPYKHARVAQRPPAGSWLVWWIRAGRGFGKTRSGAEWAKHEALRLPGSKGALVCPTYPDGRDVMVEGDSGLLSILAPSHLRGGSVEAAWNRSIGELYLANGSRAKVFSSERPGRLRGPQHHWAWGDEPAEWLDANIDPLVSLRGTTWSNLLMGCRLGQHPRIVLTGTPKTNRLILGLLWRDGDRTKGPAPNVVITTGSTYDNLANLAPTFQEEVLAAYEGTTLGQQELHGLVLEDNPGALWRRAQLDRDRIRDNQLPALSRVAVGVDPSGGAGEQGIVVVGKAADTPPANGSRIRLRGHGYVLDDRSCHLSPDGWGRQAVLAWHDWQADLICVEVNFGGDMAVQTITAAAAQLLDEHQALVQAGELAEAEAITTSPRVKLLRASRGKRARAEPVSAVYEQGRIHHVGTLAKLEDELCEWVPDESTWSPNRLDAAVWACIELGLAAGAQLGRFGGRAMATAVVDQGR
jgi:phage terminase large subunit-like protein